MSRQTNWLAREFWPGESAGYRQEDRDPREPLRSVRVDETSLQLRKVYEDIQ